MSLLMKPPCNRVDLPIPLNLVHFLIPNLATEFDMTLPLTYSSDHSWGFATNLAFRASPQLDPHRKSIYSVEQVASFIDASASNASASWAIAIGSTQKSLRN